MGIEIERKYLVDQARWQTIKKPEGVFYRQGYIHKEPGKTIRIRITDKSAFITIKGQSHGATRLEYEYGIPITDAEELLKAFCGEVITKVRYCIDHGGKTWEIDVFSGDNAGLIIAEIELTSEDEQFTTPDWIGQEVTHDKRYFNSNLSSRPYAKW